MKPLNEDGGIVSEEIKCRKQVGKNFGNKPQEHGGSTPARTADEDNRN
jgi:hypothetical protein